MYRLEPELVNNEYNVGEESRGRGIPVEDDPLLLK
jgi:hypothetical protein